MLIMNIILLFTALLQRAFKMLMFNRYPSKEEGEGEGRDAQWISLSVSRIKM